MITKRYTWKVLSDDGLLKEPDEHGPYYARDSLNGAWCKGFQSEQEALAALDKWDCWTGDKYVLVTLYTVDN